MDPVEWQNWLLSPRPNSWPARVGELLPADLASCLAINNDPDPAGIAILAYAPLIYTSAMQDRMRWMIPVAPAAAFGGATILLASRNADTISSRRARATSPHDQDRA